VIHYNAAMLAGHKSMDGGKASVADQVGVSAANFAGSAARFAVAAPVAVISPQAREILKEELSSDSARIKNGRPV
jgi:hypothetical protein